MSRYTRLFLISLVIAASGVAAYAQGGQDNDAAAIVQAKVSLGQAVAVAEQHANGKAARAECENTGQGWVYDVEVVSGTKVYDARVDADKGNVISAVEDLADRDDDHDERD